MATGPKVNESLAPAADMHPATFERYLAELRQAGLIQRSGKGGGKAGVHFGAVELATIICALSSPLPGGAADAVRALDSLRHEWGGDGVLRRVLASEIERRALLIRAGGKCLDLLSHGFELTVCLRPLEGLAVVPLDDGGENRQRWLPATEPLWLPDFAPPSPRKRGLCRLTTITVDLMNVAAHLCADTMDHQQTAPIPAAQAAETENAALPGAAPTQAQKPTRNLEPAHPRRKRETSQPPSGPGHHHEPRSLPNGKKGRAVPEKDRAARSGP